jgi:hypothetical protein
VDLAIRTAWSRARAVDATLSTARLYGLIYLNETTLGLLVVYYDRAHKEYVISRAYSLDEQPLFRGAHGITVAVLVQFYTPGTVWSREPLTKLLPYEEKGPS